jgi:hypothetical protein
LIRVANLKEQLSLAIRRKTNILPHTSKIYFKSRIHTLATLFTSSLHLQLTSTYVIYITVHKVSLEGEQLKGKAGERISSTVDTVTYVVDIGRQHSEVSTSPPAQLLTLQHSFTTDPAVLQCLQFLSSERLMIGGGFSFHVYHLHSVRGRVFGPLRDRGTFATRLNSSLPSQLLPLHFRARSTL